ncbi:MAG: hypothetical protein KJP17_06490 [Gammaproteobacteria bacterium]|nr:hypothetical protein [Gammaproteobacteria bacterium]
MKANIRSICGATLMLVIIPILAGLLACIPVHVPLGNPERARVDPQMSGYWYAGNPDEFMGAVLVMQPWDKRTWLVINVLVEIDEEDISGFDISTYDGMVALLESGDADADDLQIGAVVSKGWLSKFDGQRLMTLEIRSLPNESDGSLEPWAWWDYRVVEVTDTSLALQMVDDESEFLENVPGTQRDWEKIMRKHAKDDALYYDVALVYQRVDLEHEKIFGDLVATAFTGEL